MTEPHINGNGSPHRLYLAIAAAAIGLLFAGIIVGKSLSNTSNTAQRAEDINTARSVSRSETCRALFSLFESQRDQIAQDDLRLQSGIYDKVIPQFSTPQIKQLSHESALRKIDRFDNSRLPSYCPQEKLPEQLPKGFKR